MISRLGLLSLSCGISFWLMSHTEASKKAIMSSFSPKAPGRRRRSPDALVAAEIVDLEGICSASPSLAWAGRGWG